MSKLLKILVVLVFILGSAVSFFLYYIGFFGELTFSEKEMGPYKLVYLDHKGDYSKSGDIQMMVYKTLIESYKVKTSRGFGIYFDNPKKVEVEYLRSQVGCILEEKDFNQIGAIQKKFKVKDFPKTKSVVTQFPYKNKLSILAGMFKVYPRLEEEIKEKGYSPGPVMEIYDMANKKIYYILPLSQAITP